MYVQWNLRGKIQVSLNSFFILSITYDQVCSIIFKFNCTIVRYNLYTKVMFIFSMYMRKVLIKKCCQKRCMNMNLCTGCRSINYVIWRGRVRILIFKLMHHVQCNTKCREKCHFELWLERENIVEHCRIDPYLPCAIYPVVRNHEAKNVIINFY